MEQREKRCRSCEFIKRLSSEDIIAVNKALAGMRDRPYTNHCGKLRLLVAREDLPFTTRFPEETFPNVQVKSCHSPRLI